MRRVVLSVPVLAFCILPAFGQAETSFSGRWAYEGQCGGDYEVLIKGDRIWYTPDGPPGIIVRDADGFGVLRAGCVGCEPNRFTAGADGSLTRFVEGDRETWLRCEGAGAFAAPPG